MRANELSAADYGLVIAVNGALIVLLSLPIARWAEGRAPALVLAEAAAVVAVGFLVLHAMFRKRLVAPLPS